MKRFGIKLSIKQICDYSWMAIVIIVEMRDSGQRAGLSSLKSEFKSQGRNMLGGYTCAAALRTLTNLAIK